MIPLSVPVIGAEERAAVDRILMSGYLAGGPEVEALNLSSPPPTTFAMPSPSPTEPLPCNSACGASTSERATKSSSLPSPSRPRPTPSSLPALGPCSLTSIP